MSSSKEQSLFLAWQRWCIGMTWRLVFSWPRFTLDCIHWFHVASIHRHLSSFLNVWKILPRWYRETLTRVSSTDYDQSKGKLLKFQRRRNWGTMKNSRESAIARGRSRVEKRFVRHCDVTETLGCDWWKIGYHQWQPTLSFRLSDNPSLDKYTFSSDSRSTTKIIPAVDLIGQYPYRCM